MADYYVIPTNIGEAKMANALALGIPLAITELALGDGEGEGARGTPVPNPEATALVSERRRAPLNSFSVDPDNPNVLIAEQVIPETAGGWWIREMGLFDEDGDMIFVCNTPPTYKPQLTEGSGRTQVVRMSSIVSDSAAVTLKVDPSTILATREYVDSLVVGVHEELMANRAIRVDSVAEGFEGRTGSIDTIYLVKGWYPDQEFGGDAFAWLPDEPKSSHDGGVYISPTVPAVSNQAGATAADRQNNFRDGTGETDPGGTGVFARLFSGPVQNVMFGGTPGALSGDAADAANAFVRDNVNEATAYQYNGHFLVGTRPLPTLTALRDVFQVSRILNGKTDCHAFADKTLIENATDSGTYGTFDATTEVGGSHFQNHQFSFQDRAKYTGTGTLQSWGNIIWPAKNGTGTVDSREDIEIRDVAGTGGVITSHIGLYIRDLQRANSNVAINLEQSSGNAVFAPNEGAWTIGGHVRINNQKAITFNRTPSGGAMINGVSDPAHSFQCFIGTNPQGPSFTAIGDGRAQISTNGAARLVCDDSASGYAVRPGLGNSSQSLGTASNKWSEVFAANGTINTSDERQKQQIEALSAAEKRVAVALKSLIVKYKFNDAVERKGDHARTHIGAIAQQVAAAFEAEGLDPFAYGIVCFDTWGEEVEEVETDGNDPEAYSVETEVRKVETVEVETSSVEMIDGRAVLVKRTATKERPVTEAVQVVDENGNPVYETAIQENDKGESVAVQVPKMHYAPVMEKRTRYYRKEVRPAGEAYGLRYEQLLCFIVAGL